MQIAGEPAQKETFPKHPVRPALRIDVTGGAWQQIVTIFMRQLPGPFQAGSIGAEIVNVYIVLVQLSSGLACSHHPNVDGLTAQAGAKLAKSLLRHAPKECEKSAGTQCGRPVCIIWKMDRE